MTAFVFYFSFYFSNRNYIRRGRRAPFQLSDNVPAALELSGIVNFTPAEELIGEGQQTAEQLVAAFMEQEEPEQCYSMLFCTDATGW